ncbi:hypothetical protein DFH09DRAFT_1088395 [Mycena vulgaris]|nr:hypothetical protein DFH09DRAFT_1088395 [Mycena vulgaris]
MGMGARFAALEGMFGFHNWRRLIAHYTDVSIGLILKRRLAENIKEGKIHQDAFNTFNKGLTQQRPELVKEWRVWVEKYEKEQHVENKKDSPYECAEKRELVPQDGVWMYMPKLRRYLSLSQKLVWDADDREPEATRLFMPSDFLSPNARMKACARALDGIEARLRDAEAGEALDNLREGLRTRTAATKFKICDWSGQRALTCGQGILRQLKGHGKWENVLQLLTTDNVRALNERSLTEEEKGERERLLVLGEMPEEGGISAVGDVVSVSEKEDNDERLHEVEWAKAYSRSRHWCEDAVMVEEEMRRTITFGDWAEALWRFRAGVRTVMLGTTTLISAEVVEGVKLYAMEHADRERRTSAKLELDWGPIRQRAAEYLKGKDISGRVEIVIPVDHNALRWAEATVYEREEGENNMYQ